MPAKRQADHPASQTKKTLTLLRYLLPPLQNPGIPRKWKTHSKVQQRDHAINRKRPEGCISNHVPRLCEFGEPNNRSESSALNNLNQKPNSRRNSNLQGLRPDNKPQLLRKRHPKTGTRGPLPTRHGLNTPTPDIRKIRTRIKRQSNSSRDPGRHINPHQRQPKKREEKLHQQRRALKQLHIQNDNTPKPGQRRHPHREQHQSNNPAPNKRNQRQQHRPPRREQQIARNIPKRKFDHDERSVVGAVRAPRMAKRVRNNPRGASEDRAARPAKRPLPSRFSTCRNTTDSTRYVAVIIR